MTADGARIVVHRRLSAPPHKVFAAFADARLVSRWLTPSPDISLSVLEFDFREGGTYRFAYGLPDGRKVVVRGSYRAIEPPSKVVFSWLIEPPDEHTGIDSVVTVTITPDRDGAVLVISHERLTLPSAVARHVEGWRAALDQLAAMLDRERAGA